MFGKTRKTVRFDLTDDGDLERYDLILNDPLCRVVRELKEQRTETEYTGGEDGTTTTKKFPILIVTYETRERL